MMNAEPPRSENSFGLRVLCPTVTTRSVDAELTHAGEDDADAREVLRSIAQVADEDDLSAADARLPQSLDCARQPCREPGAAREHPDPRVVAGGRIRQRRAVELRSDGELVVLLVDVVDHPLPAAQGRAWRLRGQGDVRALRGEDEPGAL